MTTNENVAKPKGEITGICWNCLLPIVSGGTNPRNDRLFPWYHAATGKEACSK